MGSNSSDNMPLESEVFDYVVIGGGTAGLAMAARLVEGSSHSIAVIEAGGFYEKDNGNLNVVPGYCTFFAGTDPDDVNPLIDWGFVTEPQKVRLVSPFSSTILLTRTERPLITDAFTTLAARLSVALPLETSCTIIGKSSKELL